MIPKLSVVSSGHKDCRPVMCKALLLEPPAHNRKMFTATDVIGDRQEGPALGLRELTEQLAKLLKVIFHGQAIEDRIALNLVLMIITSFSFSSTSIVDGGAGEAPCVGERAGVRVGVEGRGARRLGAKTAAPPSASASGQGRTRNEC